MTGAVEWFIRCGLTTAACIPVVAVVLTNVRDNLSIFPNEDDLFVYRTVWLIQYALMACTLASVVMLIWLVGV